MAQLLLPPDVTGVYEAYDAGMDQDSVLLEITRVYRACARGITEGRMIRTGMEATAKEGRVQAVLHSAHNRWRNFDDDMTNVEELQGRFNAEGDIEVLLEATAMPLDMADISEHGHSNSSSLGKDPAILDDTLPTGTAASAAPSKHGRRSGRLRFLLTQGRIDWVTILSTVKVQVKEFTMERCDDLKIRHVLWLFTQADVCEVLHYVL